MNIFRFFTILFLKVAKHPAQAAATLLAYGHIKFVLKAHIPQHSIVMEKSGSEPWSKPELDLHQQMITHWELLGVTGSYLI